ncbi:hypothetical protein STRCI_008165 [Streptomyces cinnabarinus]|uniref:Uncharacterized protein n=1 Tax=Streptomyces cinnabarinus TaxID=67287 RepID=A0ABY7KUC8_9ACTN|nr:hypothetical protein [Streptomyces cinnabarinus]WAZ26571.1 hypothetical protein STRCI_008165 [Streptomyces cinnabarinus]
MTEDIVTAALAKISEGSGARLIDLIRRHLSQHQEPSQELEVLTLAEHGTISADDKRKLEALLLKHASQDPTFREHLHRLAMSVGVNNSVTSSTVHKLIQAQNVGSVSM